MNSGFEIEITRRNGRAEAYCPIFPECFGIGQNEDEAVEDLADSIAMYMGDMVKNVISDMAKGGIIKRIEPVTEIKKNKKSSKEKVNRLLDDKISDIKKKEKLFNEKGKFLFSPQFKEDMVKIESLIKSNNHRPIMKGGILSILGLKALTSPVSITKKSGYSEFNDSMGDILENGYGIIEQLESYDSKSPESILLGIPLSFN